MFDSYYNWFGYILIAVLILEAFSYFQNNSSSVDSERVWSNSVNYSSFEGYECTDDCSGHEAGYAWAEENGISDPSECDGNSNSFIEGCISFAESN